MKQKPLLCPSMMCADFCNLTSEIQELESAGTDIFHCDIMDGIYVPNFSLGLKDVEAIRALTDKPIDCHLMIENPFSKIDYFIDAGVNIIYIHPDSERYVSKTLNYIKDCHVYAGLAINPDTSLSSLSEILYLCDYIIIMTVNPGFSGQRFIEFTDRKIRQITEWKRQFHYKVIIDGNCSPEVVRKYTAIGVDGFVLGTSSLFGKEKPYSQVLRERRE